MSDSQRAPAAFAAMGWLKEHRKNVGYWAATLILVVCIAATGVLDVTGAPEMAQHVTGLGYPAYLQHFLGAAKLLGAVVIVAPKLARLKEWAYAGITFDLVGATYSHLAHRDDAGELLLPVALLVLTAMSYFLRPDSRRLTAAISIAH